MFGGSRRKSQACGGKKKKYERSHGDEERTEQRLLAQKEAIEAKLAAIKAAKIPQTVLAARTAARDNTSEDDAVAKDYGDQRVVIKFFYEQFGSPAEADWKGRYGTISRIRSRMGDCAPKPDTVERTLKRLVAGDEEIASKPQSGGGTSLLSADEDILVGLLACRGFSQPMALQFLNLQRYEVGLQPVSLRTLRRAEARVQLLRRKRRSQKSGSVDLESTWALASLAQSVQLLAQFKAGAALRGEARPAIPSSTSRFNGWADTRRGWCARAHVRQRSVRRHRPDGHCDEQYLGQVVEGHLSDGHQGLHHGVEVGQRPRPPG